MAKKHETQESIIDLASTVGILLDYKKLVLAVIVIFVILSEVYMVLSPPEYQSDAMIQIEKRRQGIAGIERLADLTGQESEATTEIELIKSRYVIGKAVDRLQLTIQVEAIEYPYIGNYMIRRFEHRHPGQVASNPLPFSHSKKYNWGGAQLLIAQMEVPEKMLGKTYTLVAGVDGAYELMDDDVLILSGKVGQRAEKDGFVLLIDKLAANPGTYFMVSKKMRIPTINSIRASLSVVERGRRTGIIGISYTGSNLALANNIVDEIANQYVYQNVERTSQEAANSLRFVRDQLPQVRDEMEKATKELNAYQVSSKSVDISTETKAVLDQMVKLDASLSDLKMKQVDIATRFTREHPSYQILLKQMSEMEAQQKALQEKVGTLPQTQQELFRLQRNMDVSIKIYTQLLNKEQELDVVRAGTVGNARIIDKAEGRRTGAKDAMILLMAVALGFLTSAIVAWVHVYLTRGIENPEDIEKLGLPVNAIIPYSVLQVQSERGRAKTSSMPMLSITHPTDPAVEAIRSLRTSIYFIMQEARNNIVMISGPSPLAGKTFVSVNLAVVMAQADKKVLVIDADMRKGYMHCYFDVQAKETGLSSVLQKKCAVKDAIMHSSVKNLDFMSRGTAPDNPSELLLSPLFAQMLKQVSANYDFVIIDTPPIMAVADAIIVSKQAGSNFIVSRWSKNPLGELQATMKRFENNGIKLNGAILNAAEKRSLANYGYQKYAYGNYQYDYGYTKSKAASLGEKILGKRSRSSRSDKNS